jgi:uncharacterized SAM-binding protein YcdF (DUF218 family)
VKCKRVSSVLNTLLHYLSKATALAFQPLAWVALLLVCGLILSRFRPIRAALWGRRFCFAALVLLLLLGWQGPPNALLRELEDRYAVPTGDLSGYVGMVVLGGVFGGFDGREHGQPALGCAAERVVIPVPLMAEYPHMQLLFSGGSAAILSQRRAEADVAASYFKRMGVDMQRVALESRSRNTFENAAFTAELIGDRKTQRWLLVTSAAHMPRAMATFKREGWNVTAYPVDYQSAYVSAMSSYSLDSAPWEWALWFRETTGLLIYRWLGRA